MSFAPLAFKLFCAARGDSPFPPSKNVSLAPRVPIRTIRLMIRAHVAAKLPQTLGPFRTRSKPEADAAPALDDADMADAAPAPAAMPGQRRRILRFLNIPAFPTNSSGVHILVLRQYSRPRRGF